MPGGYCGTLLEVDLTQGTVKKGPLRDESVLRTWVGGIGLGMHLLCQNIRLDAKALDPDTPIIIMTGPMTGTKAPNSSDWKVITLNPWLDYHPVCSQGHGHFGARLKHAGYDGIIIRGKASAPVYLWIDDEHVELRDASKYWGLDTFETQRSIAADHKDIENISVACIGPAGEKLVPGASLRADGAYGANKGSCGMVFGFKNLKAIAVRGTKAVPIHDLPGFLATCEKWRAKITEFQGFRSLFKQPVIVTTPMLAEAGWIPFNNFQDDGGRQVEWGKRWAEDVARWKVTPVGSWECDIKCHHDTLITTGPCAGTRASGFGPENFEGAATMIGVDDPGTCLAMANFYDAMGCDPCDAGHLIALAFEMYNKGLLTEEETRGLKLEWGNDEAARELFFQMLNREGLGAVLAQGFRKACDQLGRGAHDMIMHIKGVGHNDHDLRAIGLGPLLGEVVSGAGPTWQGFFMESAPEPDLDPEPLDLTTPDGKALSGYRSQLKKLWSDCTGECWFASMGVTDSMWLEPLAVSQATGFNISADEAQLIGERVVQLLRLFAVARGFKKAYELDIAPRLLERVEAGPAKGRAAGPHLRRMLDEYYGFAGWDLETGVPSKERLAKVGLADYRVGL
jgi:aldehyde:ferredoxin oxidoreductase